MMQRRRTSEEKNQSTAQKKNKHTNGSKMRLIYMKISLAVFILAAILVYLYLYMKTPDLPFPMSPEMEALYKEHGPGEAKQRRREDLNKEQEAGVRNEIKEEKSRVDKEDKIIENKNEHRKHKETKETYSEIIHGKNQNDEEIENEKEGTKGEELEENMLKSPGGEESISDENEAQSVSNQEVKIHVAIVACGDRAPEAINSLKSFAMLSKRHLYFHIFAEPELHKQFNEALKKWPGFNENKFNVDVLPIQFPGEGTFHEWKKLFKPCASQRLFLPLILKDVDSVIYIDTDVLMLRPPEDLWEFFEKFNKTQLAGLAPEGEVPAIGWYNRFARHPYYGALGVNSGVMLMNLTRMRRVRWNDDIYPIFKQYRYDITWGDQDILNILFHFKPEMLYVFPCEWNYRPDHCMYGSNCQTALANGVSVVHGNRGVFHNAKQPEFKVIYDAFKDTKFGKGLKKNLKIKIEKGMEKYHKTYCGENGYIFSKSL